MNKYKTKVLTTQRVDMQSYMGGVFEIADKIPVPRSPFAAIMAKAKTVDSGTIEVPLTAETPVRGGVVTIDNVAGGGIQGTLPLDSSDQALVRPCSTLLVPQVEGCDETGMSTPGKALMLYVTGIDNDTNNPIVREINGQSLPSIPSGSTIVILADDSDTPSYGDEPKARTVYLQRVTVPREVESAVAVGFDTGAVPSTAMDFKSRIIKTFIAGIPAKTTDGRFYTEGVRWQFRRDVRYSGALTAEGLNAALGIYFDESDSSADALLLVGSGLAGSIQRMDSCNMRKDYTEMSDGCVALALTTAYGTVRVMYEPALDRLGWPNDGMLVSPSALTRYTRRDEDGTEYAAVVADGRFGIWITDNEQETRDDATVYILWKQAEAPEYPFDGAVYILLDKCPGIADDAVAGTAWRQLLGSWLRYIP